MNVPGIARKLTNMAPNIPWSENLAKFIRFVDANPSIKYLQLQWLDLSSVLRVRILPVTVALQLYKEEKLSGVPKGILALMSNDHPSPVFTPSGEQKLWPDFDSLRLADRHGHATVQCEFQELNGDEVARCPRTVLRRTVQNAASKEMEFLIGFEVEVVFASWTMKHGEIHYGATDVRFQGHSYSAAASLYNEEIMAMIETILQKLEDAGVSVHQIHPEGAPAQFEFCLAPLPPLAAVDALVAARNIIASVAANHSLRATLYPKPFADKLGNGAHIHISFTPPHLQEMFYAGVLKHLRAITAFTYPNAASYERVGDSMLSGSSWVSWGTQNRETPLRRIEGSHYEIRCADGFANMYLAVSAIIGAGLLGVSDAEPIALKDCQADPATLSEEQRHELGIRDNIPSSITESLSSLHADSQIQRILGPSMVDFYLGVKEADVEMLKGMDPVQRKNFLIGKY